MRAFSIASAAEEHPLSLALVTETTAFTFADLQRRAVRVVADLKRRGVREQAAVALVPSLRPETIVALYALMEMGAPIVLLHPRLLEHERAALLRIADVSLVLDENWTDRNLPDARAEDAVSREHAPESAMTILFTSGSTGVPKGVVLSRRAFAASAAACAANLPWQPDDRWALCMPMAHVGGLSVVVRCLAARVPVVFSAWTGSVEKLLNDIARQQATILSLVPTMLSRILEEGPERPFPDHVRAVLLGGDAARPALLEAAAARGVPVLTTYGMTETCSQIATLGPGEIASAENGVGRPLRGTEIRIVDGEIQVRGPTLFTNYVSADGSPFHDDGWFRTGDLGSIDEAGRLHVAGRRSDLIITGGENVDPREVELALESCMGVRAACVFPLADERWGEIVAAAIVLDPDQPRSVAEISTSVRAKIAQHKWPRRFAVCTELSLNATGKLDRRATARSVTVFEDIDRDIERTRP